MTSIIPVNTPEMSPAARVAVDTLNKLARELAEREKVTKVQIGYYTGTHPLRYASPEFARYFGSRFAGFNDNWVAPVVNSPAERMNPLGVRLDEDPLDREGEPVEGRRLGVDPGLERAWRSNDGDRGFSEAVVLALSTGRAFATVWGSVDDTPVLTFERPDQAIVEYGDRGQRVNALRLWRDDRHEYAVVDDGAFLWKFQRDVVSRDGRLRSGLVVPSTAVGGWTPRQPSSDDSWPIPNPLGEPATVELANHSLLDRDNPLSDIDGVIAMQDAINLIWAYLMNALDYASLPQRVVTGTEVPKIPVLDENGQVKGSRPLELDTLIKERILWIPGQNAKIAEWSAASLDVFSAVIERAVEHIAAQTRTPPHYLIGKIQNVSAEALTAAETGLVAKTRERTTYLSPGLRDIYRLMALAMNDERKALAVRSGTVVWDDFQYRALGQKVDALQKLKDIGFPFEWIAEQYGLHPLEVQRVLAMREAESRDDQLDELIKRAELVGKQSTAYGTLIRAGVENDSAEDTAGLPDMEHTGLLPVTVQSEEKAVAVPGTRNGERPGPSEGN